MAIDFQYGGLPPAMQRNMERIGLAQPGASPTPGMPQIPQAQGMMPMPQIPQMQGVGQMPQMPQMQGVPGMDMLQQFMPQAQQGMQNMGMQGKQDPMSMLQQYMPQGTDRKAYNQKNMSIIDAQKVRSNQMNMGPQDVGNTGGNGGSTHKGLGSLSAKYESNGNPGTIADNKHDIGGASYGSYQLSTNSGHAKSFANSYGGALKGLKPGSTAFNNAWKAEAKKNPKAFQAAQHKYIENNHYKPAAANIKKKTGFDVSKYPKALQDAVWSIGVQHGAGGAASIFKAAGIKNGMGAADVLRKVYAERSKVDIYFRSTKDEQTKKNVKARFGRELQDALKML